jgi:hypothetical protein
MSISSKIFTFLFAISISLNIEGQRTTYQINYLSEFNSAIEYYKENKLKFNNIDNHLGKEFIFSIVAPELSQYGVISDLAQTYSLKVMYAQGGKDYSDFSIGYFQMKPSFIEKLETEIVTNRNLNEQFGFCLFPDPENREARVTRIERLEQLDWQITYLRIFLAIMNLKTASIQFPNDTEKLKYFATAYNLGFEKSKTQIENNFQSKQFPHFGDLKFNYSEVSQEFYQHLKDTQRIQN